MTWKASLNQFLEYVRYYLNFKERHKNKYLVQMQRPQKMNREDLTYYQANLKSEYTFRRFILKALKWLITIWFTVPVVGVIIKLSFAFKKTILDISRLSAKDQQVALVTFFVVYVFTLMFLALTYLLVKRYIIRLGQEVSQVNSIVQQKQKQKGK